MKNVTTIGIDIAKTIFHAHGVDRRGKKVFTKKLKRADLLNFMANIPRCLIGMEACSGAHYWAKRFQSLGHTVRLMNAEFVKPYVKSNKNDWRDAEAIAEAVTRPNMRFVPIKGAEQLEMQSIHRARHLLVQQRTAASNQIRGLLAEYGLVIPVGIGVLRKRLPEILDDAKNELTGTLRQLFQGLLDRLNEMSRHIKAYDLQLEAFVKNNEQCQRLISIKGIGPKTASILVATITDTGLFKNGRELAAWLGLVPRQHSSGGKAYLLGISKRGDRYIRTLLIHGARSALSAWQRQKTPHVDRRAQWALSKAAQIGHNKACVALANKMARTAWALLSSETMYDKEYRDATI